MITIESFVKARRNRESQADIATTHVALRTLGLHDIINPNELRESTDAGYVVLALLDWKPTLVPTTDPATGKPRQMFELVSAEIPKGLLPFFSDIRSVVDGHYRTSIGNITAFCNIALDYLEERQHVLPPTSLELVVKKIKLLQNNYKLLSWSEV